MSTQEIIDLEYGANGMWVLVTATFVVFLQAGFALREVGTVQAKNTNDILYKFLLTGAITAITWWILGYGFAFGNTKGGFLGVSLYGLDAGQFEWNSGKPLAYQSFFQAWAYAITAVTIATGSLGERVKVQTVLILVAALSIWIYPIIVHWCWGQGWLSPFANQSYDYLFYGKDSNNYIDAAGSGVVHTVGGVTALVGAIALGARKGRFDSNVIIRKNSPSLIVAGTLIFWVAYYGYNCGSTGAVVGQRGALAGKIAAVTTLSAAFSAVTALLIQVATESYDLTVLSNAILAGLVGVSAACSVIEMWGAMLIGISSCLVYLGASKALVHFKIDDVVDAFAVHGAVGIWGALNVGIFGSDYNGAQAGYLGSGSGNAHAHPFRTGEQFGVQLVGIICIVAWTAFWTALVFFGLKLTVGIRVAEEVEEKGDVEPLETRDEAVQAKLSASNKV